MPEIVATYFVTKGMIDPAVEHLWQAFRSRVDRVVDIAKTKAGWTVPDERTAWAVFDAARVTDDLIVADYLGGVLAASGATDGGVPIAALIGRLSSTDLRTHYVLYATYQSFIDWTAHDKRDPEELRVSGEFNFRDVFVPMRELFPAVGLTFDKEGTIQLEQALRNLARERLLGQVLHNGWDGSPAEPYMSTMADVRRWWKREPPEPGIVFAPSADGLALMGWGLGLPDHSPLGYVTARVPEDVEGLNLPACPSAVAVLDLPEMPQ